MTSQYQQVMQIIEIGNKNNRRQLGIVMDFVAINVLGKRTRYNVLACSAASHCTFAC